MNGFKFQMQGINRKGGELHPGLTAMLSAAAANGMTVTQAAKELGVTWRAVRLAADRRGIKLKEGGPSYERKVRRAAPSDVWTTERLDILKRGWEAGKSASAIAAELGDGFTRNAVLGKLHRLRGDHP